MIPIRLTLQGLYSYQEKQSIDFTRLIPAHIFGIFGPVGSGKSAILEAISYALYGKTDRMNLTGDNRYYNMMNLKSNELLIEFVFSAGKQDTEYLTLVKSRRNRKQFEDVRAIDHTAYKKIDNTWIPIDVGSLEAIIGLSYENFKRTIIIPQGKFQEFLQLGNKERTQMMKELFNLEKYELYFKVVSLESKNNQQIQGLEGQLKQLGEISPKQIEEGEIALAAFKIEIETKQQEMILQQAREIEFRKLRDLVRRIRETEMTINRMKDQENEIDLLERNIRDFEYCSLNFKGLFESAAEISGKISRFEKNIADDNELLAVTNIKLTELRKNFDHAKKEFEGREAYNRMADELEKIAKLHELQASGKILTEKINHSEKIVQETNEGINKIRSDQVVLRKLIRDLKERHPDMALLSEVKEWHAVNRILESAKKETEDETALVNKDIDDINRLNYRLWLEESFAGIPAGTDLPKAIVLLEEKKNELKKLKDHLAIEAEHLSLQARMEEYATNLQEGKPCPLCGSLTHPLPLDPQNVTGALASIKEQLHDNENLISAMDLNQKKIRDMESQAEMKKDILEKLHLKHKEQNARILSHQAAFKWDSFKNVSEVTLAFSAAEKLRSQISSSESQMEEFNKKLEEQNQQKENTTSIIDKAKHQLTANVTESKTLRKQIELLNLEKYDVQSVKDILQTRESFLSKYKEAESNYQTLINRQSLLQKDHDNISGRLQANREALTGEIKSKETTEVRIAGQLKLSSFASVDEVKKILARVHDVENEKNKVTGFRQSFDFSQKQLGALKEEMGEQHYDELLHRQLVEWLKQATEELTAKNQLLGKLESELKKMKADLVALVGMKQYLEALLLRADDIKTMKQLFKASGFVNYISTVYLQELCHAANERFYKLTRQKLSLEVTDDNNFQVRDFLNGGKVRNVKTLSGGQTFQAALSLSLALADSIQKITESNQNFFFLDEGFGSLDKDSLSIVFDTLKSLRKENRIVGVISHVEEMQQEIDNYLKISMDDERGSLIQSEPYGS